jgi:hypothetical protein
LPGGPAAEALQVHRVRLLVGCFALAAFVAGGIPLGFGGGSERSLKAAPEVTPSPASPCPFEVPRGTTLAAARKVVVLFMFTTIMRGEPACGFDVAAADLRGKLTRRQWSRGNPVVPFLTRRPRRATFSLVPQAPTQVIRDQRGRFVLPLYLTLRAPDAAAVTYDLRLVRGPGRWLIDWCSPRPGRMTGVRSSLNRHKSPVTGRTFAAV